MKRTLGLILVLVLALGCVFSFASCKKESAIYGLVASASPTKTVTLTDYTAADGTIYEGEFIMSVEGNNSIFYFHYQRPSTVEEGMADVEAGRGVNIPIHLQSPLFKGYKYPHDYPGHYVEQQYLPNDLVGKRYYEPASNKTEQAAAAYWEAIKSRK